jgi:hypothetical protein
MHLLQVPNCVQTDVGDLVPTGSPADRRLIPGGVLSGVAAAIERSVDDHAPCIGRRTARVRSSKRTSLLP